MPFTLAHPAAVLPLMRRPFDGLALACGAIAPDIPYYIRAAPLVVTAESWYEPFTNATVSHSAAGLVPVTLPLALVAYLLLRATRRPLIWLTRGEWSAPVDARPELPPRVGRWAWVAISLLVGALSHLVWDSATSGVGFLAARFGALNEPAFADLTWIRLSQHASTVIGLAVLAVALWRRRRTLVGEDAASRRRTIRAAVCLVAVASLAGAVAVWATFDPAASSSTRDRIEVLLSTAAMGAGAAVGMAVVVATICWWLSLLRVRRSLRHQP